MKKGDDEYKTKLWEYFASKGGNPCQTGIAVQGWYLAREKEFVELMEQSGQMGKMDRDVPWTLGEIRTKFSNAAAFRKIIAAGGITDRPEAEAGDVIREVYGELTPENFDSMSDMVGFFAARQNLVYRLIKEELKQNTMYSRKQHDN